MKATVLAVVSIASAFPLMAGAIYNMTLCDGSYAPCATTGTHRQPDPDQVIGLDNQAFYNYFNVMLPGITPPLDPSGEYLRTTTASTASGTVIGDVLGPSLIEASYIFRNGQVLCCVDDAPFQLKDINSNGYMVGIDPQSFIGGSLFAPVLNSAVMTPERIPILISNGTLSPFAAFTGIDDGGRIFGQDSGQNFVLTPVPEPGSAVLLLTVLAGAAALQGKRRVQTFRKWS